MKIGYLVPKFPGQTHIFFWREIKVLEQMNVEVDIISTKLPPSNIMSHTWTEEALSRTTYLFPPTKNISGIITELFRCGIRGWWRCLNAIVKAETNSFKEKLNLFALMLMGAQISNLARVRGWNHLHVHSCANSANIAMFAKLISDLSYSLTLHGPTLELYGKNQKQKWKYASFVLVVSKKLLLDVKQKLKGFIPSRITFVAMGVDTINYKRIYPYQFWESGTPCRIFSIGRLNPIKGQKYLIEAIKLLKDQGLSINLNIAGEDEKGGKGYHQELENFIKELSLSNDVSLLGAVSEEKIRTYLEQANIFVLASLNEGISVAIMEAMAMELPIVVTNVGGVKELVDDQVNGILVEPENPLLLATTILSVLQDQELSIRLGKAAREKIVNEFDSSRSARMLIDAINSKS
jgi:glycosyltransferase involved in cell wall biosynthesis